MGLRKSGSERAGPKDLLHATEWTRVPSRQIDGYKRNVRARTLEIYLDLQVLGWDQASKMNWQCAGLLDVCGS